MRKLIFLLVSEMLFTAQADTARGRQTHREELERQRLELEQKIQDVHQQYERAKSMAQLTKQGHVYVISNICSFGENVFKIGMTRRLEPMERVKELSGAAVPFDFDVHAMISCDDAPALEKTLHDHLESYRINRINLRKEFFRVELSIIIDEVSHSGALCGIYPRDAFVTGDLLQRKQHQSSTDEICWRGPAGATG